MKHKIFLVGILFIFVTALGISTPPLTAQDDGLAACTEAEIDQVEEILSEEMDSFGELGTFNATTSFMDYRELATDYANFLVHYWDKIFPDLPDCAEAKSASYAAGIVFNEMFNSVLLGWQGLYEAEYAISDSYIDSDFVNNAPFALHQLADTEFFAVWSEPRDFDVYAAETLAILTEGPSHPCPNEDFDELREFGALSHYVGFDPTTLVQDTSLEDLSYLVPYYANMIALWERVGGVQYAFLGGWCPETEIVVRFLFSESLKIVSMQRISLLEAVYGSEALADEFAERAVIRIEVVQEFAEEQLGWR